MWCHTPLVDRLGTNVLAPMLRSGRLLEQHPAKLDCSAAYNTTLGWNPTQRREEIVQ